MKISRLRKLSGLNESIINENDNLDTMGLIRLVDEFLDDYYGADEYNLADTVGYFERSFREWMATNKVE
jgi:hypothetical protein